MQRTLLLIIGSFAGLAGLWLGQFATGFTGWPWLIVVGMLLVACVSKRKVMVIGAVIAAGLLFGLWRAGNMVLELRGYNSLLGQKLYVSGYVVEDATYNAKKQQDFRLQDVVVAGRRLPGQLRVTIFGGRRPHRGDYLVVDGKLYEGFGNYQAAIYYAHLDSFHEGHGRIEALRRWFAARVYSVLPDPEASLGLGFLVGIKSQLPDSLNDQLRLVGLTHIVVASGYNLTILVRLARRLFEKRSKYQTALASVLLIAGFVMVTGFSASMSRAALVTGLSLAAWYYGRQIHPLVILGLSAFITAAINPMYVWADLGWWLSFLAFAGVMLLSPVLQKRIYGKHEPKLLGQVVLETVSAEIMTLPLIVMVFGTVPLLALPANILVVPLVPLAMLLTFVAGAVGWTLPYLALPATWLLTYMINLVSLFAGAKLQATIVLPVVAMLMAYATLAAITLVLWRVTKHDPLARNLIE